jgi:hypothetical protein
MGYIKRWFLPVMGAILLNVTAATPAFSQAENKTSQVTFASWVEIPDQVLPGGTYIFRVSGSPSGHHTVRIYDRVTGILVATEKTVPQLRENLLPQPSIVFEQHSEPNPQSVTTWFRSGSQMGEGFVYLTHQHETFFVPVEQPAASLQDWQAKTTPR